MSVPPEVVGTPPTPEFVFREYAPRIYHIARRLLNNDMPAGTHTVTCDLGDMPAGPYYCRLQNGSRQQMKNMLKVR